MSAATQSPDYEEIVRKLVAMLIRKERLDKSTAEDLAQQGFAIAWEKQPALRESPELFYWCLGVVHNLVFEYRRGQSRYRPIETESQTAVDPPEYLDTKESAEQEIESALLELDEQCCKATLLLLAGAKRVKIAEVVGVSVDTLNVRMSRCRQKIKLIIQARRARRASGRE